MTNTLPPTFATGVRVHYRGHPATVTIGNTPDEWTGFTVLPVVSIEFDKPRAGVRYLTIESDYLTN